MKLNILADENIPQLDQWFSHLGNVRKVSGRGLTAEQIGDANVLLVRSVTEVDESLLKNSQVKFVGTATIGTDHLDKAWLSSQNIAWVSAPGSNATSVVEYVLAALAEVDDVLEQLFDGAVVGIVGGGNVGSRLHTRLRALNIATKVFDPFLTEASGLPLVEWSEVLKSDVLCFHTPLTRSGHHPTFHMLDEKNLAKISDQTLILNAGRGAAIDNQALLNWLEAKLTRRAVLDVWENEPIINTQLFNRVRLGTPHIAGYSLDGKYAGSWQLYQALTIWLRDVHHVNVPEFTATTDEKLTLTISDDLNKANLVRQVMQKIYPIKQDHENLAAVMQDQDEKVRGEGFDRLRKTYPVRREISAYQIANASSCSTESLDLLCALGFNL